MEYKLLTTGYNDNKYIITVCEVSDFGASGNGVTDDTEAFEKAFKYANSQNGGAVFVDKGKYKITRPLYIPKSVYLTGVWHNPDTEPEIIGEGSILCCCCGKNDASGKEFISIGPSAGIIGLTIYYPEQSYKNPIPYPAAIKSLDTGNGFTSGFATVRNTTIINAYAGLMLGPDWNELHVVENLYMCCLNKGFFINMVTDIGRLDNINISSEYWCRFDKTVNKSELIDTMKKSCIGIEMQRADWQYCFNVSLSDLHTGILFNKMTDRDDVTDGSNSQMYNLNISNTKIGIDFNYINTLGVSITKGSIITDGAEDSACMRFSPTYMGTLQTLGVELKSKKGCCVFAKRGSKGNMVFSECGFEAGLNAIMLDGCSLSAFCCKFSSGSEAVFVNEDSVAVTLSNNEYNGAIINKEPSETIKINHDKYFIAGYSEIGFPDIAVPEVRNVKLINALDFDIFRDDDRDSTKGIQEALNQAKACGGGIVYLPGGIYKLYGQLNIPSGVELRGVSESGHHSNGMGTVLYTYANENNEDAEPFMTIEPKAGLRGVCIWYPKQSQLNPVKFPWTVRGLGEGIWLLNVNIAGAYKAVDFGTFDCKGHYIKYLTGQAYKNILWVDKCSDTGYIRNCHFNPHFLARVRNSGLTLAEEIKDEYFMGVLGLQDIHLEAIRLDGTKNEQIFDLFNYRAKKGMILGKHNPFDGVLMAAGLDGGAGGIEIVSTSERELIILNSNADIVPGETFYLKTHKGTNATVINSNFGAFNYTPENGIVCNDAKLKLIQVHFRASALKGAINAASSKVALKGCVFSHVAPISGRGFSDQKETEVFDCRNDNGSMSVENSIFRVFSGIENKELQNCISNDYANIYMKD